MYFILTHMLDLVTDKQTRRFHYLYDVINIYTRDCQGSGLSYIYTSALRGENQNKLNYIIFCHCIKMKNVRDRAPKAQAPLLFHYQIQ